MIKLLIQFLFFGSFLLGPISVVVLIGVMIHFYRKSDKDHKEHPEKYRNRKGDNFCYSDGSDGGGLLGLILCWRLKKKLDKKTRTKGK